MKKIFRILKSRFINKKKLGIWYKNRIEICSSCIHNSKNKKLSLKEQVLYLLNGTSFCTKCGCGIKYKASIKAEQCPLKEPRWIKEEEDIFYL